MKEFRHVIRRGLTYEGDGRRRDVVINYTLIILVLLPYVFTQQYLEGSGDSAWAACLAIALVVQVLLWFVVGATGVSIIWSALAGFILMDLWRMGIGAAQPNTFLALLALGGAGAGIVYYAFTFPPITTIGHVCAVTLGVVVWFVLR